MAKSFLTLSLVSIKLKILLLKQFPVYPDSVRQTNTMGYFHIKGCNHDTICKA